jgi:hypothetical protein
MSLRKTKIRARLHDVRRERDNLYNEEIGYKDFIYNSFAAITKKNNVLQLNSTAFQAEYTSLDTMQKRVMVIHNANNAHRQTINNAPEQNNENGAKAAIASIRNSMPELRTLNVNARSTITSINAMFTTAEKAIEAHRIEDAIAARVQIEVERELIEARARQEEAEARVKQEAEARAAEDNNAVPTAEELLLTIASNTTDSSILASIAIHPNANQEVLTAVSNNPYVSTDSDMQSRIATARVEAAQTSTANTTMPQYTNVVAITAPINRAEAIIDTTADNNSPRTKLGSTPKNSI